MHRVCAQGARAPARLRVTRSQLAPDPGVSTAFAQPPFAPYAEIEVIDGRVVCHVCGRLYRLVALHAWKAHGITGFDYREEFGLARGTSLACPATAQRLRELALTGQGAGRHFDSSSEHSHSGPVGPRRAQVERVHQAARRRMQADGIFQAAGRRGRRRYEEKRRQQLVPRYLAVRAIVTAAMDPRSRRFHPVLTRALADAGLPMAGKTVLRYERSLGLAAPACTRHRSPWRQRA